MEQTYLKEAPSESLAENEHGEGGGHETTDNGPECQLEGIFLLSGASVNPHHHVHEVGRSGEVEDLEDGVPPHEGRWHESNVGIACGEDGQIKGLGEQRNTFGGLVAEDGPDQYDF